MNGSQHLRSRLTKQLVEKLRNRVARAYSREEISRARLTLLMEDIDKFERHAFMPRSMLTYERHMEQLGYKPVPVIRLSKVPRFHRAVVEMEDKWVRQHKLAPLTTRSSVCYGGNRQVRL